MRTARARRALSALALLLLVFGASFVGCGQPREAEQATALSGESAPTVFRSTLDGRPRALTAELDDGLWGAWDVGRGALFVLWRDGVDLDGAVYTGRHGPQPASVGPAWLRARLPSPWQIRAGGRMQRASVRHLGHSPARGTEALTLRYEVGGSGQGRARVVERVSVLHEGGVRALERHFSVEPEGALLALDLELGVLDPERDVETDGRLEPRPTLHAGEAGARLWLRPAGETRLRLRLSAEPGLPVPDPARPEGPPGRALVEQLDCLVCHGVDHATTGPALRDVAARYPEADDALRDELAGKIRVGGSGVWGPAPMTPHPDLAAADARAMVDWILTLEGGGAAAADAPPQRPIFSGWGDFFAQLFRELSPRNTPGDGLPLAGVHPSFDLETVRPEGFAPRVGGLDFLPDGRLVVASWDAVGGVYLVDGLQGGGQPTTVKRIAEGLAEPLGVEVVGGEIFVLQKPEITQLVDRDGDDLVDEYRTVSRPWGMTPNFHEFAFGLAQDDGYFYVTLATAIVPGGASARDQAAHRGRVVRVPLVDGPLEFPAYGLRTPNGVGLVGYGPEQRLYVTDNQGDWLPASKLLALHPSERDVFFGSRSVEGDAVADLPVRPPVVWLPQGEIGNSPGEPLAFEAGPYRGQLLVTDVTHGGLKRVFVEAVGDVLQGTVFRFTQGLEAGVNRAVWGPHGRLYVGGIGSDGNWGQADKQRYGLQRLTWNGRPTFEMLAVRTRSDGFEIELTAPVAVPPGPDAFAVGDWRYVATEAYGGPKIDARSLEVSAVDWSQDGRRARLRVGSLEAGRVVYLRLDPDAFRDAEGQALFATEAWVTLNALPVEPEKVERVQ